MVIPMATDECCCDQQLDTDEQKEEPAFKLPRMFANREPVRREQKRDGRAKK